mgnify:CR=1 FL=1
MKEIKSCPINPSKCEFKKARMGCTKHINPNECSICTKFRKRQSKTSKRNVLHFYHKPL